MGPVPQGYSYPYYDPGPFEQKMVNQHLVPYVLYDYMMEIKKTHFKLKFTSKNYWRLGCSFEAAVI